MLIEKGISSCNGIIVNISKYKCDMCHTILKKEKRILVSASELGGNKLIKKWDLCENCMRIIEKNVKIWYDKIVNKK